MAQRSVRLLAGLEVGYFGGDELLGAIRRQAEGAERVGRRNRPRSAAAVRRVEDVRPEVGRGGREAEVAAAVGAATVDAEQVLERAQRRIVAVGACGVHRAGLD